MLLEFYNCITIKTKLCQVALIFQVVSRMSVRCHISQDSVMWCYGYVPLRHAVSSSAVQPVRRGLIFGTYTGLVSSLTIGCIVYRITNVQNTHDQQVQQPIVLSKGYPSSPVLDVKRPHVEAQQWRRRGYFADRQIFAFTVVR